MKEYSIYFATPDFYDVIRNCGGTWNDTKERPIVCLLKLDNDNIYWAVPMGNFDHRNEKAKERLQYYINLDKRDIRSCYYHIGKTNVNSIFFMSDAIPIIDKYIDRTYNNLSNNVPYTIKNKKLKEELSRKLKRILKYENQKPNFFRQHITDVKNYLLAEMLITE